MTLKKDLNNDGVFDKKDKAIAAKILNSKEKKTKKIIFCENCKRETELIGQNDFQEIYQCKFCEHKTWVKQ